LGLDHSLQPEKMNMQVKCHIDSHLFQKYVVSTQLLLKFHVE
jgi:hypothetical protein